MNQCLIVNLLRLERIYNFAERAVDEVKRFQKWSREGLAGMFGVACCLLAYGNRLKVATEKSGGTREAFALDFGVGWRRTFDPIEESSDMEFIISDGRVDRVRS